MNQKSSTVGLILEVPVTKGVRYALCTHLHKKYGSLVRIFDVVYRERPADCSSVVNEPLLFSCFLPLDIIIQEGILKVAGKVEIPKILSAFPIFRMGVVDPATKKVKDWWLWDGEREWIVGKLSKQQMQYPIRGIWNDTLFLERAESAWTVSCDTR
jgi:hypothetical protein